METAPTASPSPNMDDNPGLKRPLHISTISVESLASLFASLTLNASKVQYFNKNKAMKAIIQNSGHQKKICRLGREICSMGRNRTRSYMDKGIPAAISFEIVTSLLLQKDFRSVSCNRCRQRACTGHITLTSWVHGRIDRPTTVAANPEKFVFRCGRDTVICTQTPTPTSPGYANLWEYAQSCALWQIEILHLQSVAGSHDERRHKDIVLSSVADIIEALKWPSRQRRPRRPRIIVGLEGIVEVAEITSVTRTSALWHAESYFNMSNDGVPRVGTQLSAPLVNS